MIYSKDKNNSKDNSSTNNKYEPNESIINNKSNELMNNTKLNDSIFYKLLKNINIVLEKQ